MSTGVSPRERLVETAAKIFYERGIPNVGINEVTERAGVARMTLYNNFATKDDLVLAALKLQAERRCTMIEAALARPRSGERKLRALFDVAEELAAKPQFRGCVFINACLQLPDPGGKLHAAVRAHKEWIRLTIEELLRAESVGRVTGLAQQILALWDGGIVEAYIQQTAEPVRATRLAAIVLLRVARGVRA